MQAPQSMSKPVQTSQQVPHLLPELLNFSKIFECELVIGGAKRHADMVRFMLTNFCSFLNVMCLEQKT
jgi:hypothetical protein